MTVAELLDFEAEWLHHSAGKEIAIRARGLSPTRFYQLLHRAAASLEGIAHDPITARIVRDRRPA